MNENPNKFLNNAESPETELIRDFNLYSDAEGRERTISTKRLAPFSELSPNFCDEEGKPLFPRAEEIIKAFSENRNTTETDSASTITRKPHLLIVGGFVRDLLLDKKPKDIDFATNLELEDVKQLLNERYAEEIAAKEIYLDQTGEAFGVARLRFRDSGEEYEIASFRQDIGVSDGRRPASIAATKKPGIDAERRDFTINALFYNPVSGTVIDYAGGLRDIDEKKLRFVGDAKQRLAEDNLRALRYIRFLFKTGFSEDSQAETAITESAAETASLPPERVIDELKKTLAMADGKYGEVVARYAQFGLLKPLIPQLYESQQIDAANENFTANLKEAIATLNALPAKSSFALFLAGLLDQLPDKTEAESDKKETADVIVMRKLKIDTATREAANWIISNQSLITSLSQLSRYQAISLISQPHFLEALDLIEAKAKASSEATDSAITHPVSPLRNLYETLTQEMNDDRAALAEIKKVLRGDTIVRLYKEIHGKQPAGITIGKLKNEAETRCANQRIVSIDLAEATLRDIISEHTAD